MSDRTNHTLHKRAECVESITLPYTFGDVDFIDIWRAGSKRAGYVYGIATMSEGTFRWLWLTEDERARIITALAGTA